MGRDITTSDLVFAVAAGRLPETDCEREAGRALRRLWRVVALEDDVMSTVEVQPPTDREEQER